jgi:hypothetical protein
MLSLGMGAVVVVTRIFYVIVWSIANSLKVFKSLMMPPYEYWDPTYSAFMAMLTLDVTYRRIDREDSSILASSVPLVDYANINE